MMPCGRAMEDNVMPSGGVRRLVIKFYAISASPEEESKVKRERERESTEYDRGVGEGEGLSVMERHDT